MPISLLRRTTTAATLAVLAALSPNLAAATEWREEGPSGGNIVDVTFDSRTPGLAWAAAASGGVFRSDDSGLTWRFVGRPATFRRISWLEVDPAVPSQLWLGIDNPGNPSLWRSKDQGVTWELVTDSYTGALGSLHPVGYRIAFAPSKPSDIWVPSTSLHYRSRDSGKTWSDFRVDNQDVYAIAVDPKDANVVYAGGHGGDGAHLARSDDGGKTWKPVGAGLTPPVHAIVVDAANPALVTVATRSGRVFVSADRGETFTQGALAIETTHDIDTLRREPTSGRLWIATEGGAWSSDDHGVTWKRNDRGTGRYIVRAVAVDPAAPATVLAASAGSGVYRSTNAGSAWSPSGQGVSGTWIEKLFTAPGANRVFAQAGTGLFRREPTGSWVEVQAPFEDTGEVELDGLLFDTPVGNGVWAFDSSSAWRSTDGGLTFKVLERKEPSMREIMKGLATPEFRSLAQDLGTPSTLYAGSWSPDEPVQAVFRSTDGGKTWTPSGTGLPAELVSHLLATAPRTVFAVVAKSVYRTSDGATSWSAAGSGLPSAELRTIAVDPTAPERLFVATEEGLFRTTNNGGSWEKCGSALAEEDIEAVAVAPNGHAFAGSFRGVFQSTDGGTTWTSISDGLRHRDIRALAVGGPAGDLRLWAGTAGGGVFSRPLP